MLLFVLPTEKRLVVTFWTFFQISRQTTKHFCWWRGIFLKSIWNSLIFPLNQLSSV